VSVRRADSSFLVLGLGHLKIENEGITSYLDDMSSRMKVHSTGPDRQPFLIVVVVYYKSRKRELKRQNL